MITVHQKLWIGFVIIVILLGLPFGVFVFLLTGPYSQRALVLNYEAANLTAIQSAKLPTVDTLPFARTEYPRQWVEVPGFRSPLCLSSGLIGWVIKNGPLEGAPYKTNKGIIFNDIIMIETHGWVNGKDWGLAYTTSAKKLPPPYWTKHLVGNWSVWYTGGDAQPEHEGQWYK